MRKPNDISLIITLLFLSFSSCSEKKSDQVDLINNNFMESQNELKEVVNTIVKDAETTNLEGLKNSHLVSDKFTKFGPRGFERQNVDDTNESELAFFGTISNYEEEVKDLKIDVFGEVGIATYYRFVSFEQDHEKKNVNLRQTLVFLKTNEGWKIIHEHGNRRPLQ
ncbi:MAG: nuclear transport factor 2 family protein [Flavobacteriaceae bacterium]|nr:MAG: nuclear transport factor 2 family protein [Flavobacteriaceae bacterium]